MSRDMGKPDGATGEFEWGASEEFVRLVRDGCRRAAELADRVDTGDASAFSEVRELWVGAEMPSECPGAWSRIWTAVRAEGTGAGTSAAHSVMSAAERRRLGGFPDPVTAYRGCAAGGERGWSWTLDRSIAEDFAVRYDDEPGTRPHADPGSRRLCIAEALRDAIAAFFAFGGEDELIVDPRRLDWDRVVVKQLP